MTSDGVSEFSLNPGGCYVHNGVGFFSIQFLGARAINGNPPATELERPLCHKPDGLWKTRGPAELSPPSGHGHIGFLLGPALSNGNQWILMEIMLGGM